MQFERLLQRALPDDGCPDRKLFATIILSEFSAYKRTTTRCSLREHGSLSPKQEAVFFSVEGGGMKAESVEGVIDVGGIGSTVSIHPSVFNVLTSLVLN